MRAFSHMRAWRSIVLGTVLCCSSILSAQTSDTTRSSSPRHATGVPVVLTIEGGGSLGVYEAGMVWTLIEAFKQDQMRDSAHRRFSGQYLASVTGASAGSINALVAATSWCDRRVVPPEGSLFWRMWIRTGIQQLMPSAQPDDDEWGRGEQGVLARTYFTRVLFPELRRYWARRDAGDWRPDCSVPLGATLTRIVADTMQLTSGIRARNLHWATSTDVTVDGSLKFRPRAADRNFAGAGRIAGLPTRADGSIPPDTLLSVFAASSGYPVAFGPQRVLFTSDSSKYPCGTDETPCDTHPGFFVDGGVFDNGPLSLGLALYFEGAFWTKELKNSTNVPPFRTSCTSHRGIADS